MARTSKLFYALIGVLLIVIAGLLFAIHAQRQTTHQSHLKEQLELDGRRMDLVSEKARRVTSQMPSLKERVEQLQGRWQQVQGRLFHPGDQPEIEATIKQSVASAGLELVDIEASSVEPQEAFKGHVFNIRMTGNMTSLPAWAESFYRQRRMVRLDRVSVVSPDLRFQKFKLRATVRYFEPLDPAQLVPGEFPMNRLDIPLSYVSPDDQESDPVFGQTLQATRQKAEALAGLKNDLSEAAKLEKQIAGLEKLLAGVKALEDQVRSNRALALQNLPTLYIRVRNSPVGSAAMLIQGNDVKFPELAGDE